MKRLTQKREDGFYDNSVGVCDEEACKLGQLEDIEEELGIDLIEAKYVLDNANMTVGYTHSGKPVYTDYGYIYDFIFNLRKALENDK